jgi:hypothetical protein
MKAQRYRSTLPLTSALDGSRWLTPHPSRFNPGKETRYPLYRRLGRPQNRSGQVQKISPPPGFHTQTFQPVASWYTRYTILAHNIVMEKKIQSGNYMIRPRNIHLNTSATGCSNVSCGFWKRIMPICFGWGIFSYILGFKLSWKQKLSQAVFNILIVNKLYCL